MRRNTYGRASLPSQGLRVHVEAEKATGPARLGAFRIRVDVPSVDSTHHDSLLRTVKHCLIHNTLLNPANIDVKVETNVIADAA